jgi:uncharacterized protein (TIGR03118 family)
MRNNISRQTPQIQPVNKTVKRILVGTALLTAVCAMCFAYADEHGGGSYRQTNLVSDQDGVAMLTDTNLVNAWGMSSGPSTPIWASDNGSGLSTLYAVTYDQNGRVQVVKQGLEVMIPGQGTPTGQIFDGTGSFKGDIFIFASEDGTISGWRFSLGTSAEVLVPGSDATVYKGIAMVTTANGPTLLAANFRNSTLDAYGTDLKLAHQYSDADAPNGYAPFNVAVLGNVVFVTFAKQDDAKHDDVKGRGHGLIDIFDPMKGTFTRFATGSDAGGHLRAINSPWGLVLSPKGFGAHGDQLLVGNFGSGTIMAFEANGDFGGLLRAEHGGPVTIDGLWGLRFGNDGKGGRSSTLYFSAGPDSESHGLFGSLDPVMRGNSGDQNNGNDQDDGDNHQSR